MTLMSARPAPTTSQVVAPDPADTNHLAAFLIAASIFCAAVIVGLLFISVSAALLTVGAFTLTAALNGICVVFARHFPPA